MGYVRYLGKFNQEDRQVSLFMDKDGRLLYVPENQTQAFLKNYRSSSKDEDYVSFNDPILESAIREELGKETGRLTKADLKKLEVLDVSSYDIQDFTGLDQLTELKTLKVWMVPSIAEALPMVKHLKKLEYIDIGSCQLTSIKLDTFQGLTNLKEVALDGNPLYEISSKLFTSNKNLKWLHVDDTGIANLDFLETTPQLERLYAEDNRINNLVGLEHTPHLDTLRLSNNSIRQIDRIGSLKELETLHIENNKITDISALAGLPKLTRLRAQKNQITDIYALKELDHIEILYLDDNNIQDISALRNKKNLKQLQVRNNRIKTVEPLKKLENLKVLHIEGNQIIDVSHLNDIYDDLNNKDFSM